MKDNYWKWKRLLNWGVSKTLTTSIDFMQTVAPVIDKEDHHPEWSNVFNRLQVTLTTVKIGKKLTKRDLRIAGLLEEMFVGRE